ncbi:MAG: hypothetical protein D6826_06995 [Alphaproteobacteria bacterium]|nr:MAG: hypothetical protein D6826_06995 [Alphaproteobacteria bacterium]
MPKSEPDRRKRTAPDPWDIGFGAVLLAGSLLALFVWFPADIRGGFFHVNAIGRSEPGDAFFPVILASTLALLSAVQLALAVLRPRPPAADAASGRLTARNLRFLVIFIAITATGLAVMYWLGPLVVWLMRAWGLSDAEYRHLSDTAPYKYIGYVVGGFLMTLGLIVWSEGRIRRGAIVTVVVVLAMAITIFDLLLTNVLLPPNAEF